MSDMILFDLDGTLTDSGPGITRCVQYALASFGIEEPDLEKLNCYVGPPLLESFMNFAGLGCEEAQQAITNTGSGTRQRAFLKMKYTGESRRFWRI